MRMLGRTQHGTDVALTATPSATETDRTNEYLVRYLRKA